MKVTLFFKCPDVIELALEELRMSGELNAHGENKEGEAMECAIRKVCSKFVEYGENVQIEVDIAAGTARVLPTR